MDVSTAILLMLAAYSAVGLLFGIAFVCRGVSKVDDVARHAPIAFRLMILPGASALWPLLLTRWVRAAGNPTEEERA